MRHLPLQRLLGLHQARILGVLGDLVVLLVPAGDLHVVLVGQHEDVAVRIELRPAGPSEDLMGGAGLDHPFLVGRAFKDVRQHDRAGRQIDARRQGFGADGHAQQLALEEHFHDAAILGQQSGVVDADAAQQQLPQLGAGPLRPIVLAQLLDEAGLLAVAEDLLALDLLGHGPALVAIEAEDQGGRHPRVGIALGHVFDLLGQQLVADPVVGQRHAAFFAADQFEGPLVAQPQPVDEVHGVAHGGREQEQPHVRRQQSQGQLPDDAAFRVVEAVELVHHHGRGALEIELAVQEAIEQDFGHDYEHGGRGVLAAIAGHQADVGGLEAPFDGALLHLAELLFGQGDQRRSVVRLLTGVQGFVEGRFGDQRLAHARRRTDQHALIGREPGEEGVFLDFIGREGELVEIAACQFVAGRGGHEGMGVEGNLLPSSELLGYYQSSLRDGNHLTTCAQQRGRCPGLICCGPFGADANARGEI